MASALHRFCDESIGLDPTRQGGSPFDPVEFENAFGIHARSPKSSTHE